MTSALDYHAQSPAGKIGICTTKPLNTQEDLALAYSPGVAEPCLEIAKNPEDAYTYTNKGNLVAVISNGTAVLGLGNIGALAGKPVMEGKAALFTTFANVNAIDIEINEQDPYKLIEIIASLEPSFGGINLEDIKAPECFIVEQELKKRLQIPVFHDDQHGTAIVACAALRNALEIIGKDFKDVRIVINGAGAAGIAIYNLLKAFGAQTQNITVCDSQGVIHSERSELDAIKQSVAIDTQSRTLADAMKNSDVCIGVSKADTITPEMLLSMNSNPIVLAMANPRPEIDYTLAKQTRSDVIIGTGRSDLPNQINNVLCFPYLFRAALDVRAREINEAMKVAAATALANLAKEPVPTEVLKQYNLTSLKFGPEYIVPKPLDTRVFDWVVPAVTLAAKESGAA
jgi:malate dehydrogenase (oxaloacetate-decarboxylating)(NADP+)